MPFTLGQRWISDTESELGLGTVVAVDARTVTLLFPSTGENRLYARSDSPVTRVMFNPGDTITSHDGWQMQVEEVKEENGLLTYIGTRLDTEESGVALREVFLDSKLVFSKPQDRLFAGQIDRMDRFALRYRARKYSSEQFRMPYSGLRGQRTSLIPHQLNIAHDAERVLIIVPETLQHQWLVEMLLRFNLRFALFDDERYAEAQHDAYNPFDTEQLVICSLDFARRSKQRLEHLCEAEWDLLVVDEAHHLVWSEDAPSREYQAIEQLAEHVPGVLLLTATPEQLGMESHFARLRLLGPNRFHDFAQFVEVDSPSIPHIVVNNSKLFIDSGCTRFSGSPQHIVPVGLRVGDVHGYVFHEILVRLIHGIGGHEAVGPRYIVCTGHGSLCSHVVVPVGSHIFPLRDPVERRVEVPFLVQDMSELMVHRFKVIVVQFFDIDFLHVEVVHVVKRDFLSAFCRTEYHIPATFVSRRSDEMKGFRHIYAEKIDSSQFYISVHPDVLDDFG